MFGLLVDCIYYQRVWRWMNEKEFTALGRDEVLAILSFTGR